jgi:hypothetical protein
MQEILELIYVWAYVNLEQVNPCNQHYKQGHARSQDRTASQANPSPC